MARVHRGSFCLHLRPCVHQGCLLGVCVHACRWLSAHACATEMQRLANPAFLSTAYFMQPFLTCMQLPACMHANLFRLHALTFTAACAHRHPFCLTQIILSVAEHHSNLVPWQLVAARTGAVLKHVGLTADQELDMDVSSWAGAGALCSGSGGGGHDGGMTA